MTEDTTTNIDAFKARNPDPVTPDGATVSTEKPKRGRKPKAIPVDGGGKGINVPATTPTVKELLGLVERQHMRLPRNEADIAKRGSLCMTSDGSLAWRKAQEIMTDDTALLVDVVRDLMHARRSASAAKAQRGKAQRSTQERTRDDVHRDLGELEREMVALHKRHEKLLVEYVAIGKR